MGLPVGKKSSMVRIQKTLNDQPVKFRLGCVRGIADTDSALTFGRKHRKTHCYPVPRSGLASEDPINDIKETLRLINTRACKELGIRYEDGRTGKVYTKHWLYIFGRKNPAT